MSTANTKSATKPNAEHHTKAAEFCDKAAEEHRHAAKSCAIGDHKKAAEHGKQAQDHRMKKPIGAQVVHILSAAADEPQVLPPLDRAADEGIPHGCPSEDASAGT